ncbi:MAG: molybdopterin adenylyltransferase [Rhizobiales bacterium]|nr:molybdopterin adenylyltransferase [Hyphomicrobiales bacterium]
MPTATSLFRDELKIGVLNVSDRASAGIYEDVNGPAIEQYLSEMLTSSWSSVRRVVPDGMESVRDNLIDLADNEGCALVFTAGGTGPAARDQTPEGTTAACFILLPGFGELMRAISLREVPTAILSRQTAGIRGTTLIVNLPGRPSSIRVCLDAVFPAIPYCLDLIGQPGMETDLRKCRAYRPKQAAELVR